jgi:dTDP-4-amino-4,6-dideoxygalactose transaminase
VTTSAVPFIDLQAGEDAPAVRDAIDRVIASGWFVLGPEVDAFEAEFAMASGARHAIGVGNGTDAIALLLRAVDIGRGDEVIVPAMTAAFTALAVTTIGATPVFADVDEHTLTLDPDAVAAAITSRTRAIVPVHLYGQAADLDPLFALAEKHSLVIVEDCCQSHLATYRSVPVGTRGIGGAFSFYPTKNLGAFGDGGAVITNDATIADRIRRLRNGGQRDRYNHVEAGVNSRLDELQAAVLRARLPYLAKWTARRRTLATIYRDALPEGVRAVDERDRGHVYHLFPIRCGPPDHLRQGYGGPPKLHAKAEDGPHNAGARERDALQDHLRQAGIQTLIHYPVAVPEQEAFAAYRRDRCPVAERASGELLSLPLHPRMLDADVLQVTSAIGRFVKGCLSP